MKDRRITDGKLPDRICPHCGKQVEKRLVKSLGLCAKCLGCGALMPWEYAVKIEYLE